MNRIKNRLKVSSRASAPAMSDSTWLAALCQAIMCHIQLLKQIQDGKSQRKSLEVVGSRRTELHSAISQEARKQCSPSRTRPAVIQVWPRFLRLQRLAFWSGR